MEEEQLNQEPIHKPTDATETDFSNSIRLTGGQWAVVGIFTVALVVFMPSLWKSVEKFEPDLDYRIPHELSNDYWLYDRWSRLAVDQCDWVLIGDSVIWGEYVTREQTLSHFLNDRAGGQQFANLGVDGADPVALRGLVEHYARGVADKNVILHCNPLWMSSTRRDYQEEKYFDSSHPRLLPQFTSRISGYKEDISSRLGILVEQRVPFNSWTSHLQTAYFGGTDIPSWTLEHPNENPFEMITKGLPSPDEPLRHLSIPWFKSGITKQDFPWIDLETSSQWQAFRETVHLLKQWGNHVFVLVGPFNEHMLEPKSLDRFRQVKSTIVTWLEETGVAYQAPAALPSDLYGDASHPLAEGYKKLAEQVFKAVGEIESAPGKPRS
jgi:hypothetical protein